MTGPRSFQVVGLVLQADPPQRESRQHGDDSQTVYERTFRLPRAGGGGPPLLLRVRNAYTASDRHDREANAVWVELPGGARLDLYRETDYEKYDHLLDQKKFSGLGALRALLQEHGHPPLGEEQLQELVLLVASNYYERA